MHATVLLGPLTASRDNNFLLMRLLAALAVVVFHSYALLAQSSNDPLTRLTGTGDLGAVGVHTFFFVSGFLVARSWCDRDGVLRFAMARILRIYPALTCATLFSIVLAGWSSTLPPGAFASAPDTWAFARNALGWKVHDSIATAFATNPYATAVNVSLWTLPIELRMYVALMSLGMLGLLRGRVAPTLAIAAIVATILYEPQLFPVEPNMPSTRLFALLFALGTLAYAWRERIVLSVPAALGIVCVMLWNPWRWTPGPTYCLALGYVVLVLAYHPRLHVQRAARLGDYSYGIYVYSFPIQQAVIFALPSVRSPAAVLAASLPLCLVAAAASWHLVERPCIALKRRFRPLRASRARDAKNASDAREAGAILREPGH
jgi:peptidoglycan/LPS O-acetylase OafA/YrhL